MNILIKREGEREFSPTISEAKSEGLSKPTQKEKGRLKPDLEPTAEALQKLTSFIDPSGIEALSGKVVFYARKETLPDIIALLVSGGYKNAELIKELGDRERLGLNLAEPTSPGEAWFSWPREEQDSAGPKGPGVVLAESLPENESLGSKVTPSFLPQAGTMISKQGMADPLVQAEEAAAMMGKTKHPGGDTAAFFEGTINAARQSHNDRVEGK